MTARWSEPIFERIADLVRDRSGLVFPDIRVRDVESAIRRAASRRGLPRLEAMLDVLEREEEVRDALVAELTIGETYFQRDPGQFDLLRWRVLPELLRDCPSDRPLRVWSAGCASGEEPYSVAMLFEELGALERADIVGSDISRPRLEEAQRGIYSRWSLRGVSDAVRSRYFLERGKYFELVPRIRQHVDFRYLNLAEDAFPALSTGIWGMDVILCRNVLIYFDRATVELVARRLLASLSEHGWLILGASDPAIGELVECDVVLTDSGLVYRRAGTVAQPDLRRPPAPMRQSEPEPEPAPAEPDIFERLAAAQPVAGADVALRAENAAQPQHSGGLIYAAYEARNYPRVLQLADAEFAAGQLRESDAVLWLRSLANQGCLEEAARVADDLLDRLGPSAELLYVHSVVLLQHGRAAESAALARRSLYLDRTLVVAHLTLAEAVRRSGDLAGSRRALRNAAALLDRMPRDEIVPASDGETAGRLAAMTQTRLQLLGAAA